MLKKVKNWLGIEGVKVELDIPEEIKRDKGEINGSVRLFSMNAQTVTSLHLKLIEKYSRGRRKSKRVDEYLLAEKEINVLLEVEADKTLDYQFSIQFETIQSRMDELESRNLLTRGIARAAKAIKSVESEYRVEVEADVLGTALNPFAKKVVRLI